MGPGAGVHGGKVVAEGTPEEVMRDQRQPDRAVSVAAARQIPVPPKRRKPNEHGSLELTSARAANNLQNVDRRDPARHASPASPACRARGKSTLIIDDALQGAGAAAERRARASPAPHDGARRLEHLDKVDRHRPVADRPHAALQPGDLHRRLHADPRLVRPAARSQGARLQARPLLVQRQGRPLRGLPGRRRHQDRDALPARRLRRRATSARASATTARRWRSSTAASRSPTCST